MLSRAPRWCAPWRSFVILRRGRRTGVLPAGRPAGPLAPRARQPRRAPGSARRRLRRRRGTDPTTRPGRPWRSAAAGERTGPGGGARSLRGALVRPLAPQAGRRRARRGRARRVGARPARGRRPQPRARDPRRPARRRLHRRRHLHDGVGDPGAARRRARARGQRDRAAPGAPSSARSARTGAGRSPSGARRVRAEHDRRRRPGAGRRRADARAPSLAARARRFLRRAQNPDGGFPAVVGRHQHRPHHGVGGPLAPRAWASAATPPPWNRAGGGPRAFLARLQRPDGAVRNTPAAPATSVWATSQTALRVRGPPARRSRILRPRRRARRGRDR